MRRDILRNCRGVPAHACDLERVLVNVSRKHLQFWCAMGFRCSLPQQQGNRVRLFPSGAAWHPNTDRVVYSFILEEMRDHITFERGKCSGVTEEIRHPN